MEGNMKYYYTDPIKAAWMAKEFGLILMQYPTADQEGTWSNYPWNWMESALENDPEESLMVADALKFLEMTAESRIYVAPECHNIMPITTGDIIKNYWNQYVQVSKVCGDDVHWNTDEGKDWIGANQCQIISRDNKLWFCPEIEIVIRF